VIGLRVNLNIFPTHYLYCGKKSSRVQSTIFGGEKSAIRRLQRRSNLAEVEFNRVEDAHAATEPLDPIDPLTVFRESNESDDSDDSDDAELVYNVRDIEFDSFRRLLTANFEIRRAEKSIQWLTRNVDV
jgi:hypothetical protein